LTENPTVRKTLTVATNPRTHGQKDTDRGYQLGAFSWFLPHPTFVTGSPGPPWVCAFTNPKEMAKGKWQMVFRTILKFARCRDAARCRETVDCYGAKLYRLRVGRSMDIVTVKTKFQIVIPQRIRRQTGVDIGDLLEASVEDGKITLTPKTLIDRRLAEGLDDLKHGRTHGPYATAGEAIAALETRARRQAKKRRR